jgi:hypothetical protein
LVLYAERGEIEVHNPMDLESMEMMTLIWSGFNRVVYCAKFHGNDVALKVRIESPFEEMLNYSVRREVALMR